MKSSILSMAVLLLIWQAASTVMGLPFLPPPGRVFLIMLQGFRDGVLTPHLLISLLRIIAALVLAFVPAFALGTGGGTKPGGRQTDQSRDVPAFSRPQGGPVAGDPSLPGSWGTGPRSFSWL